MLFYSAKWLLIIFWHGWIELSKMTKLSSIFLMRQKMYINQILMFKTSHYKNWNLRWLEVIYNLSDLQLYYAKWLLIIFWHGQIELSKMTKLSSIFLKWEKMYINLTLSKKLKKRVITKTEVWGDIKWYITCQIFKKFLKMIY